MADFNTSIIQKAMTTRNVIDVYKASDFGPITNIGGQDYYQLSASSYVVHGIVSVALPLRLPQLITNLDATQISAGLVQGGVLVYTNDSGTPMITGTNVPSLSIGDNIILLGVFPAGVSNRELFAIEFNPASNVLFLLNTCNISFWKSLGRVNGAKVAFTGVQFAEYECGLSYSGNDLVTNGITLTNVAFENTFITNRSTSLSVSGSLIRMNMIGGVFALQPSQICINLDKNLQFSSLDMSSINYNRENTGAEFFRVPDENNLITNIQSSLLNPGFITITAAGHGLCFGTNINILGTINYNGNAEVIEVIDSNVFDAGLSFIANETSGVFETLNKTEQDLGVFVSNCGSQKDSAFIGACNVSNNASVTPILSLNTTVACIGNTIASQSIERWSAQSNFQVTYLETRTFSGIATFAGSVSANGNNNRTYEFLFYIDASPVNSSIQKVSTTDSNRPIAFTLVSPMSVVVNQVVSVRVRQISGVIQSPVVNGALVVNG